MRAEDALFQKEELVNENIYIIAIDQKSLEDMGPFNSWTRADMADAISILNQDPDNLPAVIGVDVMYFGNTDDVNDTYLAEVAGAYNNVVVASLVNFGSKIEEDESGKFYLNNNYVSKFEEPYEALKNVTATIKQGKKTLYNGFGEMLFTHYGVSGPLILSASSYITQKCENAGMKLFIDLKPALTHEQLDKRLIREFEQNHNRQFKNAISSLFPTKLIPVMIALSGIHPEKKVNEITKEERKQFGELIKALSLTIVRTSDYKEAIITQGGVSVKEVNPSTMESKLVKGLYFAGELLDVDAYTGGFNLQIAWATGRAAGESAAYFLKEMK